jgi:predicted nuclease of predicted toxin-antitoxin system
MKLLLDECVPRRLKNDFEGYDVRTVEEVGLKGLLDAELLSAAGVQQFDVLITVDRRMPFQQNLSQLNLALIVLVAIPCRYVQLKLLIPATLSVLRTIKRGEVVVIE